MPPDKDKLKNDRGKKPVHEVFYGNSDPFYTTETQRRHHTDTEADPPGGSRFVPRASHNRQAGAGTSKGFGYYEKHTDDTSLPTHSTRDSTSSLETGSTAANYGYSAGPPHDGWPASTNASDMADLTRDIDNLGIADLMPGPTWQTVYGSSAGQQVYLSPDTVSGGILNPVTGPTWDQRSSTDEVPSINQHYPVDQISQPLDGYSAFGPTYDSPAASSNITPVEYEEDFYGDEAAYCADEADYQDTGSSSQVPGDEVYEKAGSGRKKPIWVHFRADKKTKRLDGVRHPNAFHPIICRSIAKKIRYNPNILPKPIQVFEDANGRAEATEYTDLYCAREKRERLDKWNKVVFYVVPDFKQDFGYNFVLPCDFKKDDNGKKSRR